MKKAALSRQYMTVHAEDTCSFGGSQTWFSGMMHRCGCGIIGAADTMWYLNGSSRLPSRKEYENYIRRVKRFFLLIPFRGMPGFMMVLGMNLFMLRWKVPFHAGWAVQPRKIRKKALEQLAADVPVPFCVGPGLHQLFVKKKGITLYKRNADGTTYQPASRIRGHFMVITEIEGIWAKVSSWGEEYYVNLSELERYSLLDGLGLFTNIVTIRKKSAGKKK